MPTSTRGGAGTSTARQRQRALKAIAAKAAASRREAKRTEAAAQRVNDPKVKRQQAAGRQAIREYEAHPHEASTFGPSAHLVHQTLKDLSDAAIHAPAGLYAVGKAIGTDLSHTNTRDRDFSFKHTRGIARALARGVKEDFEHPLRHPGYTGLDVLAAGSLGAGAAARGTAAVSRIAEEGSVASRVGAAGKALVKQPEAGSRVYRHGDLEVRTPNSRNPLMRAGQKLHARHVNRSNDVGRQARVSAKHLTEERRVVNALERAPAEALAERGKRLTQPQEIALRAVHEETPIDVTIGMLQREHAASKPGTQRFVDTRQKILLHKAAARYVKNDSRGLPQLRDEYRHLLPARGPKRLAEVSGRIEKVGAGREQVLKEAGKLTEEEIRHRKAAPGRIARGARYEPPTPAKMGRPPQSLEKMRSYVKRLEGLHERALERAGGRAKPYPPEKIVVPATEKTVKRQMTRPEAEARLAELDKKYEKALKQIEPFVDPYQGESNVMDVRGRMRSVKQEEQRFRNMKAQKGGAGARYHGKQKSVSQEVRELAENRLAELADKHPGQKFALELAERQRLRDALNESAIPEAPAAARARQAKALRSTLDEPTQWGEIAEKVKTPASTRFVPTDIPAKGSFTPITNRLGGALSVARDRLAQMEKAAAKRQKPVGIVGAESFTGGRSRIPYNTQAGVKVGRPAVYQGGEPRAPASLRHPYTGSLQRSGSYRTKTSRLVAEASLEAQRYNDVLRVRDRVLEASIEKLPADHENYIAVKVGSVPKPAGLKMLEDKVEEGVSLSRVERQQLAKSFDDWKAQVFAEPSEVQSFKGYRFVRRELIKGLNKPRVFTGLEQSRWVAGTGQMVKEVNNAVRTSLLYLAPKYAIPNITGNAFLNVMQQGYKAFPNFLRSVTTLSRDPELAAYFRSAMGEGFSHQLMSSGGITQKVSAPLARGWAKVVDDGFRANALEHELRKVGFKTRQQQLRAFQGRDPKAIEAVQRAREAIGDYERLSPVERDVVRHAIFFYTWLKVSARVSKHIITEHPVQAALLAQLGKYGEVRQRQELGDVPSFAEPIFKVGGSREHPIVSNPSSANIFTAADVAKGIMNLVSGNHNESGYQVAGNLSPFLALAVSEITGRDLFTQEPLRGNLAETTFNQLTGTAPGVLLSQRLKRSHGDQSGKFYTYTPQQAWGQFLFGPLGPRGYNRQAGDELARKEHLATVPPIQRAYIRTFEERQKFYDAMKKLGHLENGRLPKPLRDAFNIEAERQGAYTAASQGRKPGTAAYHRARLDADVRLLVKYRQIPPAEAKKITAWADGQTDKDKLESARRYISDHYYQSESGFLTMISESRKYLEEQGATGLR